MEISMLYARFNNNKHIVNKTGNTVSYFKTIAWSEPVINWK